MSCFIIYITAKYKTIMIMLLKYLKKNTEEKILIHLKFKS